MYYIFKITLAVTQADRRCASIMHVQKKHFGVELGGAK
jgi:hypothetical protein